MDTNNIKDWPYSHVTSSIKERWQYIVKSINKKGCLLRNFSVLFNSFLSVLLHADTHCLLVMDWFGIEYLHNLFAN